MADPLDYADHGIDWRKCPSRGDAEHHAGLHRSVDELLTERDALRTENQRLALGSTDLERVGEALAKLYVTYTPEGVGVWLRGTNKTLDGRSPLGLIIEGRADEFCAAVNRLDEGMGT